MANSRVEYFGQTLMDVTDTTATPASVTKGKVFYQANGQRAVGTASYQAKIFEETVTLSTSWTGSGPYTQTVLTGQDTRYRVDISPTIDQVEQMISDGVTLMQASNVDGSIVVTCVGATPSMSFALRLIFVYTETGASEPPEPAEYEPKIIILSLTIPASWTEESSGKYTQTLLIGENTKYKYDLQPSPEQLASLKEAGVEALSIENENGTVKVKCAGTVPTSSITIQATKTMVYDQ